MIHATAVVHPGAVLGAEVEVGPYSIVGEHVEIGDRCWIGPHCVIKGPLRIGADNRVYQFCSIGEAPQDLKYAGEPTRAEIGEGNVFREYTTINRGTVGGGGVTRIGNHNLLMAYTHVAHDCRIGDRVIMSNAAQLAGHVLVNDHAILGGFTTVHQFCTLGEHCFTGLSSAINRDVPPFVVVAGNPVRARGINRKGLSRRGFEPDLIAALHKTYMALIRARGARAEALERVAPLRARYPQVERLAAFVESSARGVVR